jgi:hypothetical protein
LVREGGGAGLGRRPHRWEGGGGLARRDVERRGGRAVGPGAEAERRRAGVKARRWTAKGEPMELSYFHSV